MPTLCDIFEDDLTITDALVGEAVDEFGDSLHISDGVTDYPGVAFGDTMTISDDAIGYLSGALADTMHISDTLLGGLETPQVIADTLHISDAIVETVTDVFADALTISDALTVADNFVPLADTLHISDALQDFPAVDRVSDTLHVSDRLAGQVAAILADSMTISDAIVENLARGAVDRISDTLTISDALFDLQRGFDIAEDTLHISDAVLTFNSPVDAIADYLVITDALGPDVDVGGGWACNTDTYAMTRYTLPRLWAIGLVDGHVLASGQDGLYLMEADDDAGADILAHAETGLMQIGVPEARDINARDTGDMRVKRTEGVAEIAYSGGQVRVGIGITRKGTEQRYWYAFPARIADVPTTNRVKIGRGAASGFWRFLFENIDGDDFMVKEQRFRLNPLSRRT